MADELGQTLPQEDEYAKIVTENLLQRKKKKKLITSIVLGVAFALAVVIIILASVPVNLSPACLSTNFETIEFFNPNKTTPSEGKIDKRDDLMNANYDKFVKVFKQSFAEPYIAAIFGGTLGYYQVEEKYTDFSDANIKSKIGSSKYVVLTYAEEKTLTDRNGKTFVSGYTNKGEKLTFKEVYVTVNETNGVIDTNLYFKAIYPSGNEKMVVFTIKANTSKIADAWADFVD